MKFGVIVFPGSNCDYDAYMAIKTAIGHQVDFLWHQDTSLHGCDCVILPGGFSYGDYLRTGAIARFSSIMKEVMDFAKDGGLVVGICNGFQILLEAGLLPGAMLRNTSLRFICRFVHIRTEDEHTPFTGLCSKGQVLKIPIAHTDGNYFIPQDGLTQLKENDQIVHQMETRIQAAHKESIQEREKVEELILRNEQTVRKLAGEFEFLRLRLFKIQTGSEKPAPPQYPLAGISEPRAQYRILLAETSAESMKQLSSALSSEGYLTRPVMNGQEVLVLAKSESPTS